MLYGQMKQGMFFLEEKHSSLQKQYRTVGAAQRYFLLDADEEIHVGSLPVGILRML